MDSRYTHTEKMRAQMDRATELVMKWLGWTEEEYAMFKYEQGLRYLEVYMGGDEETIWQMETSRIFWGWWKKQWYMRELGWLEDCRAAEMASAPKNAVWRMRQGREGLYKALNDGLVLGRVKGVAAMVLEDSYCKDLVPGLLMNDMGMVE